MGFFRDCAVEATIPKWAEENRSIAAGGGWHFFKYQTEYNFASNNKHFMLIFFHCALFRVISWLFFFSRLDTHNIVSDSVKFPHFHFSSILLWKHWWRERTKTRKLSWTVICHTQLNVELIASEPNDFKIIFLTFRFYYYLSNEHNRIIHFLGAIIMINEKKKSVSKEPCCKKK